MWAPPRIPRRRSGLNAWLLCALVALLAGSIGPVLADTTAQTLPFSQDWSNTALITTNDDWSGVPGITGYRGDGLTAATGVDPQSVLAEGTPVVDVNANQTNPSTFTTGGVTEFELTDPTVALIGSGTAAAPNLVISLNTTGQSGLSISYILRDLDGSADNAVQQVALQYRVGASGDFTNLPDGYVADATTGPSLATLVTPVSVALPVAADNQPLVQLRIITTNAVGNDEAVGVDDIAVSAGGAGGTGITSSCPSSLSTTAGAATSGAISAADADGTLTQATITGGAVAGITLDGVTPAGAVGGQLTATLNVADTVAAGSYGLTITFANNDPTPQTGTCTISVTVSAVGGVCPTTPANLRAIFEVQGAGSASPLSGQTVSVRGVVVGDFQGGGALSGFFIQEQSGDGDPATSDGLFIYEGASSLGDVSVGELVQVSGTVTEFQGLTELGAITQLESCGAAGAIAPMDVDLPVPSVDGLERYEGMLVRIPETLTVSQNYFQGRYGQVTLSADGRLYNPTNGNGLGESAELNLRRMLVLDDASSAQNPNPIPSIGADNTLRAGDTTSGLVGLLDYGPINSDTSIRHYRLQPTASPVFTRANPRSAAPEPVGGEVRVASLNVLNYFTTLDQTGASCFPSGTRSDCRGADSATEFQRQQAKIVAALSALDADVVGLVELENNGSTAVDNLVAALNAATAPGTYAAVADPATGVGDDAIKVALIYKPARVSPVGPSLSDTDPIHDRPPVAQAFAAVADGEIFSVVVNHFKSKGSCPASPSDPNAEQGDGQGCWNARRVEQAQRLLSFIETIQASAGDDDVLVIGDLNAYGAEDPIAALESAGLVSQAKRFVPAAERYSYVFDGQAGELDHALATASLSAQVNAATIWHINADEPSVIDYNTEFKPQDLYAATPYRASDHDPLLVGITLAPADVVPPTVTSITRTGPSPTNAATVSWAVELSEAVTGLSVANFSLATSGLSGASIAEVSGSGASYTVTASAGSGAGTLGLSLSSGAGVADLAGNGLAGTPAAGEVYAIDRQEPTVALALAPGQPQPIRQGPVTLTVTFSEPVTGLTAEDISFAGSTAPGALTASVSGSGADYTVVVSGMAGPGTVTVSVRAGAAQDSAGNQSAAGSGVSVSYQPGSRLFLPMLSL